MSVGNSLVPKEKKQKRQLTFSEFVTQPQITGLIKNALSDQATVKRFTASIVSAVATTPGLSKCLPLSIISAALVGESLNLSPSPQLGYFYLIPFDQKEKRDKENNIIQEACTKASFVMGYKGYIQLAQRTGVYKKIVVLPIKESEFISFNPLEETIDIVLIDDYDKRESAPTVGYYFMFEYLNGFRKAAYWSKEKMINYADTYSPAFSAESYRDIQEGKISKRDMWKYSSFWYKNFDDMACKTMIRTTLKKWGAMSVELQTAFEADGCTIDENGEMIPVDDEIETPTIQPDIAESEPEEPEQQADNDSTFADILGG